MATNFTASDGRAIEAAPNGMLLIAEPSGHVSRGVKREHTQALREYFTAERDTELGRWRDPETGLLVYPAGEIHDRHYQHRAVHVLDEELVTTRLIHEGDIDSWLLKKQEEVQAAARYFAAHPEPKPWHDAKPGEAWAIEFKYEGLEESRLALVIDIDNSPFEVRAQGDSPTVWVNRKDPRITAGRRIWPT